MAESSERTAEEREAARLERERRRAEREGDSAPVGAERTENVVAAAPVAANAQPQVEPEIHGAEPEEHGELAPDEYEHEYEYEYDGEPYEDEAASDERALGTKRVARSQRVRRADQGPTAQKPKKRHRYKPKVGMMRTRAGRIMALIALALVVGVIWFLYSLFQPFHAAGKGRVTVTIPAHASSSTIGDLLERRGVISSAFFFELRATLDGERSDLRSGTYHFKQDESYSDVLKALTTAPPPVPTTTLTLIEGKSRRQIDALLRKQGIHGSYFALTHHSSLLDPARYGAPPDVGSLEGFLFPSTYQLRKPVNIRALIADQLRAFKQKVAHVNMSYARSKHLTPYDVLTIASIIEMEAATSHDQPLVASVIYNRLKDHMPLGMDSTTRYEFNDYNQPLTNSQLAAHSPYNTRVNTGLPPTPIGNPGLAAIEAAAHPPATHYLYFVAGVCQNGSSVFSSSYQQFLRDSAKYQNARAKNGGRSPTHC